MSVSFLQPQMAWLLLALPLVWFLPVRPRAQAHAAWRTLVLLLLVVALTQPVLVTSAAGGHQSVVLDLSDSVAVEARRAAIAVVDYLVADAGGQDVSVVQLGGAEPATDAADVRVLRPTNLGASPLGALLDLAAQSVPVGAAGAVTLVSDGRATDRHWGKALAQLAERGLPVYAMPLDAADAVFLANLQTPRLARPGETALVTVDVIGAGAGLEVVLKGDDQTILARSGVFDSAGRRRVALELESGAAGFHPVVAELLAPPALHDDPADNRAAGVLAVQEPVRLLYLGERQQGGRERLQALLGAGFAFTQAAPAGADFDAYDLVLVDDLPASRFPQAAQQALAAAVANGVGLLHSGGAAAFADGGYHGTPFADLLPVAFGGENDHVDPSVGLAIIIDTSGSMSGTRIKLAKQLARGAVRQLQPHDRIGIVEFYGAKHWAVPMQPATNKIEIDRAIGRMKAIGGTVLYPAMQEAYYGLRNVNTRFKHILLITDAGVEDDNYETMTRRIAQQGINVSTILVGQGGHNLVMSDIANWGRGRFYTVGDQFNLVELVLKQSSTRKPSRYKRGRTAVRALGGPGWWGVAERPPPIAGYAETQARAGVEVLLETAAPSGARPLLATWQHGLGRVSALMTEPTGEGTAPWRDWPDYGEFLSRVLARTAADSPPFHLTLKRRRDRLTLTAERDAPDAELTPSAYLVGAEGEPLVDRPVTFRENAPGFFEADIRARRDEPVRVVVQAADRLLRCAAPASSDVAAETQVDPRSALGLRRLAARTGGTVLDLADPRAALLNPAVDGTAATAYEATGLWPFLLLAALLAYLAELLYRRWPRR